MASKSANGPATPPPPSAHESINKTEAVRRALAEGVLKPTDGVAFIKQRFGLDLTPKLFSLYKGKLKVKGSQAKKKPGPKPKSPVAVTSPEAPGSAGPASRVKAATYDVVTHVEAIREAVRNLGAEQVKRLVGLFEG